MNGWFWTGFGALLLAINSLPAYQQWMKKRLESKGFSNVEKRIYGRKRVINILAFVYIMAGIFILTSQ